jgi:hypothetical protein
VTPNQPESEAPRRELERRYGIPSDRFCGLEAETMSRAIVAHDCGPLRPGEDIGYNPVGLPETRIGWLRQAFGSEADVEQLRLRVQFFHGRISDALLVDWMLPNDEFDRQVVEGLARLYPDLTADARAVIAGNYSYSHAK